MTKKNIILIVIMLILIAIMGINLINKKGDNNSKSQIEERKDKVATMKQNSEYQIYNTNIKTEGGSTEIKATVKNISGIKIEQKELKIVLLDKNKNEIGIVKAIVPTLEKGSVAEISAESLIKYENIVDFKIE